MTLDQFEKVVSDVVSKLPKNFKDKLDNVQIISKAWPSEYDLASIQARRQTLLFGLYTGVPKIKRGSNYSTLPDKITIFAGPILYSSSTLKDAKKLIKSTVLHEIGHHFGMNEAEISKAFL
ncbi:MAG: hypothetical protein CEO12_672 [Parcubacteria group bacterium Gr01-1014_46]|nr:MAG: hypothetical protein CEO12_672 [Parcubacteria group bacterium Gr01-1014_46]